MSDHRPGRFLLALLVVAGAAAFALGSGVLTGPAGEARLIAFEPLPAFADETCEWEVASPQPSVVSTRRPRRALHRCPPANARMAVTSRPPLRPSSRTPIRASAPSPWTRFETRWWSPTRTGSRSWCTTGSPSRRRQPRQTTPKRVISGLNTHTQYASDVYIDQPTGEIYIINNDTVHNTTVYGRQAKGDSPPDREFIVMQGNFGAAVDETRQEMYITEQRESAITVWKKSSGDEGHGLRLIQGDQTKLADPHGIAFDPTNRLLFVANYGTSHVVRKVRMAPRSRFSNWPGSPGRHRDRAGLGQVRAAPPSPSTRRTSSATCRRCASSRAPRRSSITPQASPLTPVASELYVADEITNTDLRSSARMRRATSRRSASSRVRRR